MTGCQCRSGFFTLRDCDEPPIKSCTGCGRMICTRHTSPASGFMQCLDCWAKESQKKREDEDPEEEELTAEDAETPLDDEWTYGTRHAFYASGYRPVSSRDSFDDYDAASFDDTGADDWDSGEGGGGFGDS